MGASYRLPRKILPLPNHPSTVGKEGLNFSREGIRSPLETPHKRLVPDCTGLPDVSKFKNFSATMLTGTVDTITLRRAQNLTCNFFNIDPPPNFDTRLKWALDYYHFLYDTHTQSSFIMFKKHKFLIFIYLYISQIPKYFFDINITPIGYIATSHRSFSVRISKTNSQKARMLFANLNSSVFL